MKRAVWLVLSEKVFFVWMVFWSSDLDTTKSFVDWSDERSLVGPMKGGQMWERGRRNICRTNDRLAVVVPSTFAVVVPMPSSLSPISRLFF